MVFKYHMFFSEGELDYVRILNRVLPKDIRVMGWCPVPVDFSARFIHLYCVVYTISVQLFGL